VTTRVLILGGTTEARLLAAALVAASPTPRAASPTPRAALPTPAAASPAPAAASPAPDLGGPSKPPGYDISRPASTHERYHVITSLAGRTSNPLPIAGEVRIGGFGGVQGLVDYLRHQNIDAIIDGTHPFAGTMTDHALAAATRTGTPLLLLRRPGFEEAPGDDWYRVRDLKEAAALLPRLGDRVFLTTGRQGIENFARVDGCWFLARSVEMPTPPMPDRLQVILDRGPFTHDGERRLMLDHRINVLVTKDSGGTAPKLDAARDLGIPVIVVDRPPTPKASTVATVEGAVEWVRSGLPKVAAR
jgi:precorrin-6A/cobalt-precorrin-6A reductase